MKKDLLIGGTAVAIVVGGIIFYTATKPSQTEAPGANFQTATLTGTSYVEHNTYYDIAANYASSTPLLATVGAEADTRAVTLMKRFVNDTITQFKVDGRFADLTQEDKEMLGFNQGRKEKLQINYLIASSPTTLSYIFTIYIDTLGAHGNTTFKTFTFATDPSTSSGRAGIPLDLADAFTSGTDYLDTLSSIARKELPGVIGDGADTGMVNNGTTPEEKNFSKFFFDNEDLVILFAPYEVASYAAGPQTLRIPLADLANVLKPEYR